jgi:hypothetical protein
MPGFFGRAVVVQGNCVAAISQGGGHGIAYAAFAAAGNQGDFAWGRGFHW